MNVGDILTRLLSLPNPPSRADRVMAELTDDELAYLAENVEGARADDDECSTVIAEFTVGVCALEQTDDAFEIDLETLGRAFVMTLDLICLERERRTIRLSAL